MKRLLILFLLIFLVACAGGDLDSFVKTFNVVSDKYSIQELDEDHFGEIEEDGSMSWQNLYESVEYIIDAKYEDGKKVTGYYLVIDLDQPYDELEGVGYEAGVTIAESLGLSKEMYEQEFEAALVKVVHTYEESGRQVTFSNLAIDGHTSVGMIVDYDNY